MITQNDVGGGMDNRKPKTVATAEAKTDLSATHGSECRVWLVRALVDSCELPKREMAKDFYVIASTAIEATGIVGEDECRRIIRVEEVCPISKLPDDKYKFVPVLPVTAGFVLGFILGTLRLLEY